MFLFLVWRLFRRTGGETQVSVRGDPFQLPAADVEVSGVHGSTPVIPGHDVKPASNQENQSLTFYLFIEYFIYKFFLCLSSSFFLLPSCDPNDLIWRKGAPFEAINGRKASSSDGLLAEVFRGFPQP